MKTSRRNYFRNAGMGAAAMAGMPLLSSSCSGSKKPLKINNFISRGDVVLFQGDSNTDAGRDREIEWPNQARSIGNGYAFLAASWLLGEMAEKELIIYNILIGVNDYWHFRDGNYDGTPEIYEKDYRAREITPPAYWAPDGVHPSMAGAQLMAKTWLEALGSSR